MLSSFSRLVAVMVIMFALLGQALAYASMSCAMLEHKVEHSAMTHTMSVAMSDHNMMANSDQQIMTMTMDNDCCQDQCNCPTNGCTSLSCLSSPLTAPVAIAATEQLNLAISPPPKLTINSLFRPPIVA